MKLHNILYTAGFICLFIGIPAAGSWMDGGTSFITPIVLFLLAGVLWYLGIKEDGRSERHNRK